jgi:hypothetical protein
MTSDQSSSQKGAERLRSGVATARRAVDMASSVVDEVMAGLDEVTRRTVRVASTSVEEARRTMARPATGGSAAGSPSAGSAAAGPTLAGGSLLAGNTTTAGNPTTTAQGSGAATASSAGPELADQLLGLARQMISLATDTAARVLDVVAGPVERLVDPEARQDHEAWLSLGPVLRGNRGCGKFSVVDDSGNGATVWLTLDNPLASMTGTIPIGAVSFRLAGPDHANEPRTPADNKPPWSVNVPAGGSVDVEVEVRVPATQAPGTYLGIVRSPKVDSFHLVLEVQVT